MIEDPDDRLEGDIGPAAHPAGAAGSAGAGAEDAAEGAVEHTSEDAAEELRRHEREREERRRRTNAVSGRIAAVAAALLLGFVAYDSFATALEARDRGDPWLYPPATVGVACLLGLAGLGVWALRRRSR